MPTNHLAEVIRTLSRDYPSQTVEFFTGERTLPLVENLDLSASRKCRTRSLLSTAQPELVDDAAFDPSLAGLTLWSE